MAAAADQEETNGVEVINISGDVAKFELDGIRHTLKPFDSVVVHKNHATPRTMQPGRDPVASSVELITGKRVLPVTDKRAAGAVAQRNAQRKL